MSQTNVTGLSNHVQKFWSPLFMDELRASLLLGALVNKDYDGEIKQKGDTVYVQQINAAVGELRTVGTDADSFSPETLSTSRVAVAADKRAVASFEFDDISQLQTQVDGKSSSIRDALVYGVSKQINAYLYSKVAPSSSAPDHLLNSITDFNAAQLAANRLLAAKAKWNVPKGWWVLCDPSYYSDILNASTMTSSDYVGGEQTLVGGKIVNKRFGFNILEDNALDTDQALVFSPDFLHLVMQSSVQIKVSDLHSNKKFGFVISADVIFGAALGIDGSKKHILNTASASASSIVMA